MALSVVETDRPLPYPPEALAGLVADIRSYPSFIPWLKRLDILSERTEGEKRVSVARALVGWGAFLETFSSKVTALPDRVEVALVEGPFRKLENRWIFQPAPDGTLVKFYVAYEFRNPILQAVATLNREHAAQRIIAAFEGEAKRRFGGAA